MKDELKNVKFADDCIFDDKLTSDIHENLHKAIMEMAKQETYRHCEIIFNSKHLKGIRHNLNGYTTYFGLDCDFSPLEKDLSFIIRPVFKEKKESKPLDEYTDEELIEELNRRLRRE